MPKQAGASPRPVVLGMEPDPVTRALIALYLEPHGYDVRLAARAEELPRARELERAALFLCSESGLDDLSAAKREGLARSLAKVPVAVLLEPGQLAVHTRDWPQVRERLSKPVRADALLSVLLEARRRDGTAPAVPPPRVAPAAAGGAGGAAAAPLAGFEALVAEMEMEPALVTDLVSSFLERGPHYLDEIAAGLSAAELERVDKAAHAMKGMCGNLRFAGLVEWCDRLRMAAKMGDAKRTEATLPGLRAAFEAIGAALRASGHAG
jgi:histidine phosphotransfer protein HptB